MKIVSIIIRVCEVIGFMVAVCLFVALVSGELTIKNNKTGEVIYSTEELK